MLRQRAHSINRAADLAYFRISRGKAPTDSQYDTILQNIKELDQDIDNLEEVFHSKTMAERRAS
jgi:hypothetical protein